MFRAKYIKILTVLLGIVIFASGCDEKSSSGDIVKIAPDEHSMLKEYSSMESENALNHGKITLLAGNVAEAIDILEQFVTYHPYNSVGHYYLGRAYYENNEKDKFLHHTKQAFIIDKDLAKELAGPAIGNDEIGRVFVTNESTGEENEILALKPMVWFDRSISAVNVSIEIIKAEPGTEIDTELLYEISKNEEMKVNSILFNAEGSKNAVVSVKKPESGWPEGRYKVNIFVNGQRNISHNFYIL